MKFTFPFHYRFSYVVIPKINPSYSWGAAEVDLEIKEVTGDDAKTVMRVGNPASVNEKNAARFRKKPDGSLRDVKVYDGKYFVEDDTLADFVAKLTNPMTVNSTPFGMLQPIQIAKKGEYIPGTYNMYERDTLVPTESLADVTARNRKLVRGEFVSLRNGKTEDDLGKKKAAQLKRLCDDMLLVDGRLFVRCREPVLVLGSYTNSVRIDGSPVTDPALDETDWGYPSFGGRRDQSSGRATSSLKASDAFLDYLATEVKLTKDLPEFEVVDPYWSRHDGVAYDLAGTITQLRDTLRSSISKLPRDLLEAYHILNETIPDDDPSYMTISPAMLHAVSLVASYTPPNPAERFAMARYEHVRADNAQRGSHSQERANFTIDSVTNAKEVSQYIATAERVIKRWNDRSMVDQFPVKASWDAHFANGEVILREVRSHSLLFRALDVLKLDAQPFVEAAEGRDRVIVATDVKNDPVAIALAGPLGIRITGSNRPEIADAVDEYLRQEKNYDDEAELDRHLTAGKGA